MPLFAPGFDDDPALTDLTVNLARLMFPIVLLLALSGSSSGCSTRSSTSAVPALAPVAWNLVIIAALVGLVPVLPEDDEIYAYAIGVLARHDRPVPDAAALAARARRAASRSRSTGATSASGAS